MTIVRNSLFGIVAVMLSSAAFAAPTYRTASAVLPSGLATLQAERAVFAGDASGLGVSLTTEGFNGAASGSSINYGGFTAQSSNTSFTTITGNAAVTTEGSGVLAFGIAGTTVTLTFANAINALGIDITSIDQPATSVSFEDDNGNVLGSFDGTPGFAGASFFGITNAIAFTVARFVFVGNETIGFDNLQYGAAAAVPEPAMLGLFGLGAIGLGLARRRKA